MKSRPIIFSASMIRALLDGRKTQTRRKVKNTGLYAIDASIHSEDTARRELAALVTQCPYGAVGDVLWCRESFHTSPHFDCLYKADYEDGTMLAKVVAHGGWKSPIFMPRAMSRIDLLIQSISVERLQDISGDDCIAEGIKDRTTYPPESDTDDILRKDYRTLFEHINGHGSWDANPWVWRIEFSRIKP